MNSSKKKILFAKIYLSNPLTVSLDGWRRDLAIHPPAAHLRSPPLIHILHD